MTSPFRLPDGQVQISFSGGRTSAFMLHEILRANGGLPDRAHIVFTNTGREMPETLDFVQEVGARWSVEIAWVEYIPEDPGFIVVSHNSASRDGEPFAALIEKKRYLPNVYARFCTTWLKVRPARDYLRSLGWEHWTAAIGIRADEPHRHVGKADLRERWTRWLPLVAANVSKADVTAFWRRRPFDLRLQNVGGKTPLGNCDGCFLKSEANLAALARDHPDRDGGSGRRHVSPT